MSRDYPTGRNPFFTDEDDSVGSFGAYSGGGRRDISDDEFAKPIPTKAEQLQQLKEQSMNRQLESTQRALSSIYDSERMGVATAEELLHQGEQLDNIEAKTDTINSDMKTSQKHLNSIKSVFGGIKNWWSGNKKDEPAQQPNETTAQRQSRLKMTLDSARDAEGEHPAMRIRSEDVRGFYEDDSGYSRGTQGQKQFSGAMAAHDETFNKNLDMMSDGMSRLKGLAMGLGDEIETQNDQIERINSKVDTADVSIQDKNKQMRQILGIKKK